MELGCLSKFCLHFLTISSFVSAAPQFTTFERTPRPASQRLEAERWRDSYENGERSDSYPKITASVAPHQHSAVPPPKPPRGYFLKSDDEDGRPRSALQDQLDVLLGEDWFHCLRIASSFIKVFIIKNGGSKQFLWNNFAKTLCVNGLEPLASY